MQIMLQPDLEGVLFVSSVLFDRRIFSKLVKQVNGPIFHRSDSRILISIGGMKSIKVFNNLDFEYISRV